MTNSDATPQPRRRRNLRQTTRWPASPTTGGSGTSRLRPTAARRRTRPRSGRTSERRRLIDPTTCERDYNDDETEFMKAMDRYKRENRRPFPTWSEVLEVLRSLGYRHVAEPTHFRAARRTKPDSASSTTPVPAALPAKG